MDMKKYRVFIHDTVYGSWDIKAEDASKAGEIAERRLVKGDTSWQGEESGDCGVDEVEEITSTT